MTLTALGYVLALAAAYIGWWRWRRELKERRLAALDSARRGLGLTEFVRQMGVEGVDGVIASAVYLCVRNRANLDEHRLHPHDALDAYFNDRGDVTELARELMFLFDRSKAPIDAADVAAGWQTVGDVAIHFSNGSRPYLRTVQ